MPRSFFGVRPGSRPDITLPLWLTEIDDSTPPGTLARSDYWGFEVMGRVKPGETAARARVETEMLVRQAIVAAAPKNAYDPPRIVLDAGDRGLNDLRREFSTSLQLLMAVVGAILLVACANIAGLLVVRASARQREIGTRLALGAGRARLIRQLVTESVVLAAAGGALGFAIAYGSRHLLPLFVTQGSATVELEMPLDARLLFFTAATCLATGIACGLLPAVRATSVDVASLIGRSLSGTATRAARLWSAKVLVVVQVALSFVLLVGAGLFVRTLLNLRSESLGFQPDRLLLFRMAPAQSGYRAERLNDFYERVLERIATLPGVRVASLSRHALLRGSSTRDGIFIPGSTATAIGTNVHFIAPRYFETMGIPLLVGRDIGWQDREGSPRVAVINETLARKLFGDLPPLGQRVQHPGSAANEVIEIIGVVADAKYGSLRDPAPATIYEPYRSQPQRVMTFVVRSAGNPEALVGAMRDAAATIDRSVPLFDVWTQTTQIDQALRQERLFANLVSGFALLALLLACLGIYGTLSYSVARRTPEIGLRIALGAGRRDVVGLVLRESAGPVAVGALVGVAVAAALARVVESMLFGVTHDDVPTMLIALMVLVGCALVAAWLPSARASRVEPMVALRQE
jgi:predicted permease